MTGIIGTQRIYSYEPLSNMSLPIDTVRTNSENNRNIEIFSNDSIAKTDVLPADTIKRVIEIGGTKDPEILKDAPSPQVTVKGKTHNAVIVVDTKENRLYKYDNSGKVQKAYNVSTGRETSPTTPGVYSIGWVEKYPYSGAPESTLRRRAPIIFGDAAVVLYFVDEKTGAKKTTGIMLHGCYADKDVGGNWSGGCVRMHNPDIIDIAYGAKKQTGMFIKVQ